MIQIPNFVHHLLNKIATSENFIDHSLEFGSGSRHGDGFSGIMTSVRVCGQRNINGCIQDDRLNLLCKLAPSSAARRQQFQVIDAFTREAYFYNKIAPLFAKFQKDRGLSDDETFASYPKCYAAIADKENDHFAIIMQDLRPDGFGMWPKEAVAPAAYYYKILEKFGKLHAISFALKDQCPEEYNKLKHLNDFIRYFFKPDNPFRITLGYDRAVASLKNSKHIEIVKDCDVHFSQYLEDCLGDGVAEPFGVLAHGDCHTNNLLFQHDEKMTIAKDVVLVDWQMCNFRSPVLDVLHLIFSSTDKPFRDEEYQHLLRHYHKTLSEAVAKLGSDPNKLFTYDDFQAQLKRFGKFMFVIGPIVTQLAVLEAKNLANLDDVENNVSNNETGADFIIDFDQKAQEEYDRRINGLFSDLVDSGYYWNQK